MALFSQRGWDEWIAAYAQSHRHPVNRACHTAGIPLIALSIVAAAAALAVPVLWWVAGIAFAVRWMLQLVGHAFGASRPVSQGLAVPFVGLRWSRSCAGARSRQAKADLRDRSRPPPPAGSRPRISSTVFSIELCE
jgi:hypothetical protein